MKASTRVKDVEISTQKSSSRNKEESSEGSECYESCEEEEEIEEGKNNAKEDDSSQKLDTLRRSARIKTTPKYLDDYTAKC